MVGLPARGKTFIASKLARYLRWLGVQTRVFNCGVYRREQIGAEMKSEFFDPSNSENVIQRNVVAEQCLLVSGAHALCMYDVCMIVCM